MSDMKYVGNIPVSLLVACAGNVSQRGGRCVASFSAPFGQTPDEMQAALERRGWIMSVVSPAATQPVVLSPLCPECAKKVLAPELLKAYQATRRS